MPRWTEEQKEAIYKDNSNIIVSAGAGSGKTAVLSERVIRKLKGGVNINELLILTFTNAAAGEMKDRIRNKIKQDPALVEQLTYLDTAYITTFDSYALSIVKKYHYLINISKNITIIDSGILSLKEKEILDDIFEELYDAEDKLFLNLINSFCIKDDSNIKEAIKKINSSLSLKSNKKEFLDNYIETYFNDNIIYKYIDSYINILREKISFIEDNLYLIENSIYMDYYEKLIEVLTPLLNSSDYDSIKLNVNIKLPVRPRSSDDIKEYKDNIDLYIKEIKNLVRFSDSKDLFSTILKTKPYIEAIINIINIYDERINEYKKLNDTYTFTDIALLAINLLKENESIRLELKNYYNEIMVDEYQDTSDLQEEFINLIENNNVYMVGDIKQSIYGFRNANPMIFKNKYESYSKLDGGIKIDLLKNFRSRSEVLDGINVIFDVIMDSNIGGANYVESHRMKFGNSMYEDLKGEQNYNLEVLNYKYEDKVYSKEEMEAFIIANDIKGKIESKYKVIENGTLRDCTYKDFCIIMDRGTSFELTKKIFEYLQIPVSLYKDFSLTNEIDVMLINNILGLMIKLKENNLDKEFKYYFTSVARSYLFSYTDSEIFKIIKENSFDNEIINLCANIDLDDLSCVDVLNYIIEKFNIIEKTIEVGNVEECIIRLDNLINIAMNLSNMGYTPYDLKEYISNMIEEGCEIKYTINNKNSNSVKIMNIHKSKGLEFPICYYSLYYKEFNKSDIKDKFLYDNVYGIITPYFDSGIGENILKDLVKERYKISNISERIRLLYVALTRAKEKMIIVTSLDDKEAIYVSSLVNNNVRMRYNSFLSILNSIKANISKYIKNIDIELLPLTKKYNINTNIDYKDIINRSEEKITVNEINIENSFIENNHASKIINKIITKEESDTLEFGVYIHFIFENEDFITSNNKYVKKLLNHEELGDINKANVYKEYEFIYEDNDINCHGIIDLIIEYEDKIIIVDYKLKDINKEEYKKQLKIYKDYISRIKSKKIETYLYSILEDNLLKVQ